MLKFVRVALGECVVVFQGGLPIRALGPGRYTLWGFSYSEQRFKTSALVFEALPEVRAALPADWFGEVTLASDQRALVYKDDRPVAFLRPGTHRYWTLDESVRVEVLSVKEPMPELTAELAKVIPVDEYVETTVRQYEHGLEYVRGRLVGTLDPGRYAVWSHPAARVEIVKIDMRTTQLALTGQELMTRDKVTLRLSLTVEYAVEDAALATHATASVRDAIYLLVQLASREFVSGVTLDELLDGRDTMTRYLEADVVPKAKKVGVKVERLGVKDVVLPGEMKTLLNRVIEAEKEAAANVILRREETAATRSLANTAKVMAEQPLLLRLKELESLKEIAKSIHEVRVVAFADGLKSLLPAGLLADGSSSPKGS